MNIKTRLTLAMWALPFSFILVTMGTTFNIVLTGVILMVTQMILWVNLLKEIKEN